jgi:hypothetical protein
MVEKVSSGTGDKAARLKAALKANMQRRKVQARARDVQEADDTKPDAQGNTATKAGQED